MIFTTFEHSFDVSGSCHMIVEHHLVRRSRDNCQHKCHKSQKHVLHQILQENFSKHRFLQLLSMIWQFWRYWQLSRDFRRLFSCTIMWQLSK